jgi:hypothetical protein
MAKVGSREAGDLDRWQVPGAVPTAGRGASFRRGGEVAGIICTNDLPRLSGRAFSRSEMRQAAARHLTAGLSETPVRAWALKQKTLDIVMKKRISIALAAGLLMAGASVASATEMKQSFSKVLPSPNRGQQHAAVRAPWHNVE